MMFIETHIERIIFRARAFDSEQTNARRIYISNVIAGSRARCAALQSPSATFNVRQHIFFGWHTHGA